MKVLHITYWYPSKKNVHEAIWIKRHIEALSPLVEEFLVLHLQVIPGRKFSIYRESEERLQQVMLELPLKSWLLTEFLSALLLGYFLLRLKVKQRFDLINFHIAYPNLTFWHYIKSFFRIPVVITEHWSAYHFNFGLPKEKKLKRIQRIFRHQIPVITVSKALAQDIKQFSGFEFPNYIVPNVVDQKVFHKGSDSEGENFYLMVSQWKWPKRPLIVMEAFRKMLNDYPNLHLRIVGEGPEFPRMKEWVREQNLEGHIELLGKKSGEEIAMLMQRCKVFLHCSDYETFSVVCAEAVSSGAPVVASRVGGISEVVGENGILVENNTEYEWEVALRASLSFDFEKGNVQKFNQKLVGETYYQVLQQVLTN